VIDGIGFAGKELFLEARSNYLVAEEVFANTVALAGS